MLHRRCQHAVNLKIRAQSNMYVHRVLVLQKHTRTWAHVHGERSGKDMHQTPECFSPGVRMTYFCLLVFLISIGRCQDWRGGEGTGEKIAHSVGSVVIDFADDNDSTYQTS